MGGIIGREGRESYASYDTTDAETVFTAKLETAKSWNVRTLGGELAPRNARNELSSQAIWITNRPEAPFSPAATVVVRRVRAVGVRE
jgi:hypothetical protein